MGFGFNLFFAFIVVPLTGIMLATWLITKKRIYGKTLGIILLGIVCIALLSGITQWLTAKMIIEKEDYYGEYIVNRNYFAGRQADWQYNNFRFEIKENDSVYFYVTDKEKILKTYKGTIETTSPYGSARLITKMEQPTHHILTSNPTIYRNAWDFYIVFNSPKFKNLFFKKGQWKPLDK